MQSLVSVTKRVAARHLYGGTIEVPKRLLDEVTGWALGNWVYDASKIANREYETCVGDLKRSLETLQILVGSKKKLLELLKRGRVQEAWAYYKVLHEKDFGERPWLTYNYDYVTPNQFWTRHHEGTLFEGLNVFFGAAMKETLKNKVEDETKLEVAEKTLKELEALPPPSREPVKKFWIYGKDTRYAPLKGRSFPFIAKWTFISAGGTWNWEDHVLYVNSGLASVEDVRMVVRHELMHAMQNFLSEVLNYGDHPRQVGIAPRSVKTPRFNQHQTPSNGLTKDNLHDLDDAEFHTELEDARDRLGALLRTSSDPRGTLSSFVESDKFLMNLRSVPEAQGKYQLALKELGKVLLKKTSSVSVNVSVDVPASFAARSRYPLFNELIIGVFDQSVPLYRVMDGEEVRRILSSGKIVGGNYAVKAERDFGASWASDVSSVIDFGNRQRGGRLGQTLYVARIDGRGRRFAHLGPGLTLDQTGPEIQRFTLDISKCNPGLGCSVVDVSLGDVEAFFELLPDGTLDRKDLENLRDLSREPTLNDVRVEAPLGLKVKDQIVVVKGSSQIGLQTRMRGVVQEVVPQPDHTIKVRLWFYRALRTDLTRNSIVLYARHKNRLLETEIPLGDGSGTARVTIRKYP